MKTDNKFYLRLLFIKLLIVIIKCDWVEITKSSSNLKSPVITKSDLLSSIFDDTTLRIENIKPSKEWLDYQSERIKSTFENNNDNSNNNLITNYKIPIIIADNFVTKLQKFQNSSNDKVNLHVRLPSIIQEDNNEDKFNTKILTKIDKFDESSKEIEEDGIVELEEDLPITDSTFVHNKKQKIQKNDEVQKPTETKYSILSFSKILEFLKSVQNSIFTKASKNIDDKIRALETFRDQLITDIGKLFYLSQIGKLNKRI